MDCSGFANLVFGLVGVTLPRDANDQAIAGLAVPDRLREPGDLVFFRHGRDVDHVGISLGGTMMVHAPNSGDVVREADVGSVSGYAGARRYF